MGRISCANYICYQLELLGGESTRKELRPFLLEKGYGSEAIRQAYNSLERNNRIILVGSGKSQYQIIKLVSTTERDL